MLKRVLMGIPALAIPVLLATAWVEENNQINTKPNATEAQSLNENLVGHWSFDGNSGDRVIDQSDHQAHGELKGKPERVKGVVGQNALALDGADDHVAILEDGHTPSHIQDLNKGTISVWFKARDIPVGESILPVFYYGNKNGCPNMFDASNEGLIIEVAHGNVYSRARGVFFTMFNNGCQLPSFCWDSHSDVHLSDTQGAIREGRWYHFVAVVGEGYNTGYLNGEKITYRAYNFNDAKASPFFDDAQAHERMWIGKGFWNHATDVYFDGYIDDLRIYNKPLSEEEVQNLYAMKANS